MTELQQHELISLSNEEREQLAAYCECGCNSFLGRITNGFLPVRASTSCIKFDYVRPEIVVEARERRRVAEQNKK